MRSSLKSRETPRPLASAAGPGRAAAPRAIRWGSSVYIVGVILLGSGIVGHAVREIAVRPLRFDWLALLALTVASGWATLRVPGMPISFSISDIFSIASALVFGPAAGAVTAALDGLVLSCHMVTTQRSPQRVAFNASAPAIATWAAAEAFASLTDSRTLIDGPVAALWLLASLTAFGVIAYGLNTGLVAVGVSLERRVPVVAVWRQHLSGLWLNYLGSVFGGMLLMLLVRSHTIDVIILLIPLPVILYMAFRHAVGRTQDQISHLGKVNCVYVAAIEALAQAVDAKDQVTHDHVRRVQTRSVDLARALGVDAEEEVQAIKAASLLHDVGKLAIPEHILNKPGRLTPAEYEIMKRHAPIGADILSVIDFPYPVAPIVRHHHENWDGTGYPDGLAGEQIPIGARILAVVDCFDALTSDRPYRPRMTDADALQVLSDRKATMYDPRVVDAFFACWGAELPQPAAPSAADPVPLHDGMPEDGSGPSDVRVLQTFFQLGLALSQPQSVSRMGIILWEHLRPHLPPATVVVYTYDAASDSIAPASEAGETPSGLGRDLRIPLGERLSGWVAATGQSVMNSDARLDFDEAAREATPFRSALAAQIVSSRGLLGVLSVYACQPDAFDESHRRVMQATVMALGAARLETVPLQIAASGRRRVS